jgi:hypothetical protein
MLKRFCTLAFITSAILLASCAGSDPDKQLLESNQVLEHSPHYLVLADEHLQDDHKQAILDALADWATKTNYTLEYDLKFVDMTAQPKDLDTHHTIKIYTYDPGAGLLGLTVWNADNFSAYVSIKPNMDGETVRRVTMHELGHAFNVRFSNSDSHYEGSLESVMHPYIEDDALEVSCPEIQSFCSNYGCQTDCVGIVKPTTDIHITTEIQSEHLL